MACGGSWRPLGPIEALGVRLIGSREAWSDVWPEIGRQIGVFEDRFEELSHPCRRLFTTT
jgi:hypothetical protein